MRQEELIQLALDSGALHAACVLAKDIPFHRDFRDACAQNSCGMFGKCWMCPPDIGDIDDMIAQAKTFSHAVVFQTIGTLEDSYDIEGMEAAAHLHNQVCRRFFAACAGAAPRLLPLGAGGCHLCEPCARRSNEPCRFPEAAFSSLEAYGIAVSDLASLCGMKYINGANTVTYFGALLFDESNL